MTEANDDSIEGLISRAVNCAFDLQPQNTIDAVDAAWAKLQPEVGRRIGEGYSTCEIRSVLVARWTLRIPARIELLREEYDNTRASRENDGSGSLSPAADEAIGRELDSLDAAICNLNKALAGWFQAGCPD